MHSRAGFKMETGVSTARVLPFSTILLPSPPSHPSRTSNSGLSLISDPLSAPLSSSRLAFEATSSAFLTPSLLRPSPGDPLYWTSLSLHSQAHHLAMVSPYRHSLLLPPRSTQPLGHHSPSTGSFLAPQRLPQRPFLFLLILLQSLITTFCTNGSGCVW